MSGDRVPFLNLELAASSDFNEIQALRERSLADVLKFAWESVYYDDGAPPSAFAEPTVLGGLVASASGANVLLSPGALATAGSDEPVGTLDSAYQIAFLRTPGSIAAPTPPSDSYYVLEGSVVDVVTSTRNVPIYDPGSASFSPVSASKRIERQVTFRFRIGTIAGPPVAALGWVPLAVVFRTSAGGLVTENDIFDCRRAPGSRRYYTPLIRKSLVRTASVPGAPSATIALDVQARDPYGNELFAMTGGVDITTLPKGDTVSAGEYRYLYLYAGTNGRYPVNNAAPGVTHRGMPFVSSVAPVNGINPSLINLDAGPCRVVQAAQAVCVGVFRQNSANTGPDFLMDAGFLRYRTAHSSGTGLQLFAGTPSADQSVPVATSLPANARTAILRASWSTDGSAQSIVEIRPPGGGTSEYYDRLFVQYDQAGSLEIEVPAADFRWVSLTGAAIGTTLLTVTLLGWTL